MHHLKKLVWSLLILVNCNAMLLAQDHYHGNEEKNYSLFLTAGYLYRTPAIEGGTDHYSLNRGIIDFNRNTSGFGANVGVELKLNPIGVSFSYAPTVRYDYLYNKETAPAQFTEEHYDWLFEHNFAAFKYFKPFKRANRKGLSRTNTFYVGVGHTIINTGKKYTYNYGFQSNTLDYQFSAWNVCAGIPIWKLYVEPQLLTANNYPFKKTDGLHWFLSLRVFYKFKVL